MMIGTLKSKPKITREISPFAAAAIATELSRLITKSAMIIVFIAANKLDSCLTFIS